MLYRFTKINILLFVFLSTGFVIYLSGQSEVQATSLPQLILQTKIISEGDDFATRVLGIPWDMNGEPYPSFSSVFNMVERKNFIINNGFWEATTTHENGVNLWLHWTGIEDTQKVLKLGDSYPIDTQKYSLFSYYLCSDTEDSANLYWFYDQAPHDEYGISNYLSVESGCKLYTMNLNELGTFQGSWRGKPIGLRFDAINSPGSFKIGWARLTSMDKTNIVSFDINNVSENATAYIYLSSIGCGIEGDLVGITSGSPNGTFNWGSILQPNPSLATPLPLPESFEPGEYYSYMLIDNGGKPICADSTLEIRKAPLLTIQKPSYYSGPDYASEIVLDPWGMSNPEDVQLAGDFSSLEFNDGILSGVTSGHRNWLELNVLNTINTSKYKYATSRFYVEGTQDIAGGWVQKFIWWYKGPAFDPVTTRPIIIQEGWHTYSIDLSQAPLEPGGSWTGFPTMLRFDPLEQETPANVHLDYITLTGDEIIKSGDFFEIYYETSPQDRLEVILYYDTDKNPQNGRTPIVLYTPAGPYKLFLPLTITKTSGMNSREVHLLTGEHKTWDTRGVPSGTYYISADVSNELTTTTWYSEVPVIIEE